ncbi:MAG: SDR family NAD(P)-dependent oxidoreductase, partial [Bdellovibrionota bacterium]
FITGASSGIGAELSAQLARRGWSVGLFARRESELSEIAKRIEGAGGRALVLPGDVTRREDVLQAAQKVKSTWGPVDLLVANAGIGASAKSHKAGGEPAERTIRVNVLGAMYAIDAVVESMAERKSGQIVGVSSLAGWRGLPGSAAYSASKAALTTYLETLRIDLARHGISVTTVHPGFVKTPLTAKNKNPMPFLVELEDAARIIADGIEARRREVNFPLPLTLAVRLARNLPNFVYDAIMKRAGTGIG